jgi:ankyrin repeat protein
MLAVKLQNSETARTILEFGIDPAILLLRDVNGRTPLHVAVLKTVTVIARLLLKYGPTELLFTENCVGQTPLDIAGLQGLPQDLNETKRRYPPADLKTNIEMSQRYPRPSPSFQLGKQKREIPKLRATLDTLLANGSIVPGSELATELLAFADHMEQRLAEETARKKPEKKEVDAGEVKHTGPRGTTASVYIALRNAAAARPGVRRLVHLADTQRSAKRMLEQQSVGAFAQQFQLPQGTDVEHKETDLEELQLVADLRKRSLFTSNSTLYDEDRI